MPYYQILALELTKKYGTTLTCPEKTTEVMDTLISHIKANRISIQHSNFILTLILN